MLWSVMSRATSADRSTSGESGRGTLRFNEEAPPEELRRQGYGSVAVFTTRLGLNDIILLE